MAPGTTATFFQLPGSTMRSLSALATPVATERPYAEPPARVIAATNGSSWARRSTSEFTVPGAPPRTSTAAVTGLPNSSTVAPVGPSSYSATPMRTVGKSNFSDGPSSVTWIAGRLSACANAAAPSAARRAMTAASRLMVQRCDARMSSRNRRSPAGVKRTTREALSRFAQPSSPMRDNKAAPKDPAR